VPDSLSLGQIPVSPRLTQDQPASTALVVDTSVKPQSDEVGSSEPKSPPDLRDAPFKVANSSPPAQTTDVTSQRDPTAPVPLTDDKGRSVIDPYTHQPMLRPAGLDPHFFVNQGFEDKQAEDSMIASDVENGSPSALGYEAGALSNFRRGGPWDAQRVGGTFHPEYVSYATVAIGLYAAAMAFQGMTS